eukprot:2410653-Amphidinium_carterae.2
MGMVAAVLVHSTHLASSHMSFAYTLMISLLITNTRRANSVNFKLLSLSSPRGRRILAAPSMGRRRLFGQRIAQSALPTSGIQPLVISNAISVCVILALVSVLVLSEVLNRRMLVASALLVTEVANNVVASTDGNVSVELPVTLLVKVYGRVNSKVSSINK